MVIIERYIEYSKGFQFVYIRKGVQWFGKGNRIHVTNCRLYIYVKARNYKLWGIAEHFVDRVYWMIGLALCGRPWVSPSKIRKKWCKTEILSLRNRSMRNEDWFWFAWREYVTWPFSEKLLLQKWRNSEVRQFFTTSEKKSDFIIFTLHLSCRECCLFSVRFSLVAQYSPSSWRPVLSVHNPLCETSVFPPVHTKTLHNQANDDWFQWLLGC